MTTEQQNTAETLVDEKDVQASTVATEEGNVDTQNLDAQASATPESVIESLQQQLAQAQATVEAQKESVLRTAADMENLRRRTQRDVENASKYALEKFAKEIIVVVDNLERALSVGSSGTEQDKAMREGIELTLKTLTNVLEKFNIVAVDPTGTPFNPEFHEAISMLPNPEVPNNHVMAVMQKGYSLNERLIRPAMVIVSQG